MLLERVLHLHLNLVLLRLKLYLDLLLHQLLLLFDILPHLLVNVPLRLLLQVLFILNHLNSQRVVNFPLLFQHLRYPALVIEVLSLLVDVCFKRILIEIVLKIL